ncbi:MAG: DUF2199 domain-containing protein [Terricaulis sp.]
MMTFICSVCGGEHSELPALALFRPDHWLSFSPEQQLEGELTSDWCMTPDGHYFVRCSLLLPIDGAPDRTFAFGVWSSLSEDNFKHYVLAFNDKGQSKLGNMFGWLSNELPGDFAGSLHLKCQVWPQDDRQRPLIELEPTDHPLARAQREGISFEYAQRLAHEHGAI